MLQPVQQVMRGDGLRSLDAEQRFAGPEGGKRDQRNGQGIGDGGGKGGDGGGKGGDVQRRSYRACLYNLSLH